jgi:outer membrane beta-barrel protein
MSLDLFTGALSTDPFLSVRTFGGALGWNFDENWGLQAIVWKANASDSAAYESFRKQAPNADVDRNPPSGFYGIQLNRSILYGKAAVLGSTLIYVDVFLLGGAGVTTALNGNSFTPFVGIGQKIHLNRNLSLHIDYRILRFSETLKGPSGTNERTNSSDALQMGIGLLL